MKNIAWNAMNNGRYDFWTGGKINEEKGPTPVQSAHRLQSHRDAEHHHQRNDWVVTKRVQNDVPIEP